GPAAIPLGARSPARSSHLPASSAEQACRCGVSTTSLAYLVLLRMEVAAFHPPAVTPGTRLCGPVRHVAVPGNYPASRSLEPGLSSVETTAAARPTPACNFTRRGGVYKPRLGPGGGP